MMVARWRPVNPGAGERTFTPSSASGSAETLPGSALGTPAYMSPEQAAGDLEQLGPRSDVYSLGATLYCLLTGRPAQEGDDVRELLRRNRLAIDADALGGFGEVGRSEQSCAPASHSKGRFDHRAG